MTLFVLDKSECQMNQYCVVHIQNSTYNVQVPFIFRSCSSAVVDGLITVSDKVTYKVHVITLFVLDKSECQMNQYCVVQIQNTYNVQVPYIFRSCSSAVVAKKCLTSFLL